MKRHKISSGRMRDQRATGRPRLAWLLVWVMTLALGACGTAEPTAVVATPPEPTASPTSPARPTSTPTTEPTPTTLPTPSPEPSPTPDLAQLELESWAEPSPDGRWVAEVTVALPMEGGPDTGENYYTRLWIGSQAGTPEWTVVDEWSHFGLGYTVPAVLDWGADGESVIIVDRAIPDGCFLFEYRMNLRRVDLTTGSVVPLAPDLQGALAPSPDGTMVAGLQRELVLRDLASGDAIQVPVAVSADSWQAGSIVWAPDNSAVAYTVIINPCGMGGEQVHSIVRADAESGAQTTLVDQDPRQLVTVAWPELGKLSAVDGEGVRWWVDAISGELEEQAVQPPAGLIYRTDDGIWQIGADGEATQLHPAPDAQLSPNGERVLLTRDDAMWVVDLGTGKEAKVPTAEGYPNWRWPSWGSDTLVLFGSWPTGEDPGPSAGHLTAAAQASWVEVLDKEHSSNTVPDASPDGETIAYDQGGRAALYRLGDGPEPLDLVTFGVPLGGNSRAGSPAWSPDGTRLAWVVGSDFGGGWQIAVVVLDLAATTSEVWHPYEPQGLGGWPGAPVWSPDGERLAYHLWPAAAPAEGGIWVFEPASGAEQQLGPGFQPVWSPDGEQLVYSEDAGVGQTAVWLVTLATGERTGLRLPAGAVATDWR